MATYGARAPAGSARNAATAASGGGGKRPQLAWRCLAATTLALVVAAWPLAAYIYLPRVAMWQARGAPAVAARQLRSNSSSDGGAPHPRAGMGSPFIAVAVHAAGQERADAVAATWAHPVCIGRNGVVARLPSPAGLSPQSTAAECAAAADAVAAGCTGAVVQFMFFTSSAADIALPEPSFRVQPGLAGGDKTILALERLVAVYPSAAWYFKADDDSLVLVPRLAAALQEIHGCGDNSAAVAQSACMVGAAIDGGAFTAGGAGYGFPGWVLRTLMALSPLCTSYRRTHSEDAMMTDCLRRVFREDARIINLPGLWVSHPLYGLWWTAPLTVARIASPVLSLHHMSPDAMAAHANPSFPRQLLQAAHPAGGRAETGHLESCAAVFEALGWRYVVVASDGIDTITTRPLARNLADDDAADLILGLSLLYERGGVWLHSSVVCSPALAARIVGALAEDSPLGALPQAPPRGLPLNLATFAGACAVFTRCAIVGAHATDCDGEQLEWRVVACSARAVAAYRAILLAAAGVAVAGPYPQPSPLPYPGGGDAAVVTLSSPLPTRTPAPTDGVWPPYLTVQLLEHVAAFARPHDDVHLHILR